MRRFYRGSFTIEAALIMPLAVILLVMLAELSFFLHGEGTAWQSAYLISLRREREEEISAEELMRDRSLMLAWYEYEEKDQAGEIKSVIRGGANQRWIFEAEGSVYELNPVSLIRRYKKGDIPNGF